MSCWFEPWIFTWKSICMFFHFLSQGKYIINVWGGESKMQVPKFDNRFKHLLIIWSHYKVFCLESSYCCQLCCYDLKTSVSFLITLETLSPGLFAVRTSKYSTIKNMGKYLVRWVEDSGAVKRFECVVLLKNENQGQCPPLTPKTKEQEQALLYCSSDLHSPTQQRTAAHLSDPCPAKLTHSGIHHGNSTKTHTPLWSSVTILA